MTRHHVSDLLRFLGGAALFIAGIFLFTNQVMASSSFAYRGSVLGGYGWHGTPGMGLLMIPLGIGICLMLAGASRRWASLLIWGSAAAIGAGVLNSIHLSFLPNTLWALAVDVLLIGAGSGLMLRSLRNYGDTGFLG